MQEYGICFTTVDRSAPEELPGTVAGREEAPLPAVLAAILGERKKVKNLLRNPRLDQVIGCPQTAFARLGKGCMSEPI